MEAQEIARSTPDPFPRVGVGSSLASQTFARKTGGSGDISIYAFVTLPESGKDQSAHSTDCRVHSKRR